MTPAEYTRAITVQRTQVAANVTNFPMYVDVTLGPRVAHPNGYDVHFTDATGDTNLAFELIAFSSETGRWRGWVLVPQLSNSTDTVISVRYGDASIIANQSAPATVWSNYRFVYHLDEPTGISDATGNNAQSWLTSAQTAITGKLCGGKRFGSTGSVQIANNPALDVNYSTYDWWYRSSAAVSATQFVYSRRTSMSNGFSILRYPRPCWAIDAAGSSARWQTNVNVPTDGQWHKYTFTFDGAAMRLYEDGVQKAIRARTAALGSVSADAFIGRKNTAADYLVRDLDEFRMRASALSAGWISTEFNNQNNPAGFYDVSDERSGSPVNTWTGSRWEPVRVWNGSVWK